MHPRALISLRTLTAGAAAALISLQPLTTLAQSAPDTAPTIASCGLPVLDVANPSPGSMVLSGAYTIEGMALDPRAPQGTSGIDQVSVFLGSRDEGGMLLGSTQPVGGPRQNMFAMTITLPTASIGEFNFVAYAHSALTGKETAVSFPIVIGEDPSKTTLGMGPIVESSTNPGSVPQSCPSGTASQTPSAPADAANRTTTTVTLVAPPLVDMSGDGKP